VIYIDPFYYMGTEIIVSKHCRWNKDKKCHWNSSPRRHFQKTAPVLPQAAVCGKLEIANLNYIFRLSLLVKSRRESQGVVEMPTRKHWRSGFKRRYLVYLRIAMVEILSP
ncbi:MAG: hypothetical protein ILM98_03420, partial [Kiritimatiellae bacterium]|nr:hypothetical protein [Kiritimatiellia bacterium]